MKSVCYSEERMLQTPTIFVGREATSVPDGAVVEACTVQTGSGITKTLVHHRTHGSTNCILIRPTATAFDKPLMGHHQTTARNVVVLLSLSCCMLPFTATAQGRSHPFSRTLDEPEQIGAVCMYSLTDSDVHVSL